MPNMKGIEAAWLIRQVFPEAQIVVFTLYNLLLVDSTRSDAARSRRFAGTVFSRQPDIFVFTLETGQARMESRTPSGCWAALEIFYKRPAKYTKELTQIAYSATFYLAHGIKEQDQAKTEMRKRARGVWGRALSCADVVISEYFRTPKPASDEELKREQEILKGALTIIDSAVFQLYLLFRVDEHLVRENLPSLDDP